jgi:hypothetical protein
VPKLKEVDLVVTIQSAAKRKEFQRVIDEILNLGPEAIGTDDDGFTVSNVDFSEIRVVSDDEFTNPEPYFGVPANSDNDVATSKAIREIMSADWSPSELSASPSSALATEEVGDSDSNTIGG